MSMRQHQMGTVVSPMRQSVLSINKLWKTISGQTVALGVQAEL